jgi:hypothetical protein
MSRLSRQCGTLNISQPHRPSRPVTGITLLYFTVRSLYRVDSLMTVSRELYKYKLHLVRAQEVRWEGSGTESAGKYKFFSVGRGMRIMNYVQDFFFVHKRIISAVKRVLFVIVRMSYIILRGRWCHIIVLYVHAQTEDNTDDVKDSFYEQLERVFDKFPKYHMKILLGDFSAEVGREDIFQTNNWELMFTNVNGVRVVSKSQSKVQCSQFPTSIYMDVS